MQICCPLISILTMLLPMLVSLDNLVFQKNVYDNKPRSSGRLRRQKNKALYSRISLVHPETDWCPGPDSNRHGVAPEGF
jgi:hypothetical protein